MEDVKRSYYAIVPADVRYCKELCANAKLLYGEITALCNERGYCYASNLYFSQLYEVSISSVSRWVTKLEINNFIITESKVSTKGTERHIKIRDNRITQMVGTTQNEEEGSTQNYIGGLRKNAQGGLRKNDKCNNTTVINNTVNNNSSTEVDEYLTFIQFINESFGRNFRGDSKSKRAFNARIKEGISIERIQVAARNAYNDKYHSDNAYQYLTPEFLTRADKIERFFNLKPPEQSLTNLGALKQATQNLVQNILNQNNEQATDNRQAS